VVKRLWVTTNLPCSKRLKIIIPLWLPFYPFPLPEEVREKLFTISPATIDRLMASSRSKYGKQGLTTTKPGSILKQHIPIKTSQWEEDQPGYLEVDTVAHCGSSTAGMFIYTINCVRRGQTLNCEVIFSIIIQGLYRTFEKVENFFDEVRHQIIDFNENGDQFFLSILLYHPF
jgi:hypothetical protein